MSGAGQRGDWSDVQRTLRDADIEARAVSMDRLSDLRRWFADEVEGDRLPAAVLKDFRFALRESELPALPGGRAVRSLVVAARPRPVSRAVFTVGEQRLPFTVPATYSTYEGTAEELRRSLRRATDDRHWFAPTRLPSKSLAVFSGLAAWGRNNIAYVAGRGSYVFLASFASDWEPDADRWVGPSLLPRCETCIACARACPTGAIDGDRLLLHTERCLTFMNEGDDPFPDWVEPIAHQCPVGCVACQRACPENAGRETLGSTLEFTAAETDLLVRGATATDLDDDLRERLRQCGLLDYLPQLPRNLGVLLPRGGGLR
jgi:epoxyqueuosine reductase